VVVGGGASGAYAAVRLRDDFGKSVALIEKQSILVSFSLPPVNPQSLTPIGWYGRLVCRPQDRRPS
jgi:flavin-dependent dehydrogenase